MAAAATDALLIGIESRQLEVAVALACPAPVDVEEVLTLIAVADKCVTTARRLSAVKDGTILGQFVVYQLNPVGITVSTALYMLGGVVVVEVLL